MTPNARFPHPPETAQSLADPVLEAAILRALHRAPSLSIPANFAADVTRQAAQTRPARRRVWSGWGPCLAAASAALLTGAMFALAPHAAPTLTNGPFDAELLLFAELGTLALFSRKLLHHD